MRFRGGVGHKSTRDATDQFLQDRHPFERQDVPANEDDGDMEDEGEERIHEIEEQEEQAEDKDEDENKKRNPADMRDEEEALSPQGDDEVGYGAL